MSDAAGTYPNDQKLIDAIEKAFGGEAFAKRVKDIVNDVLEERGVRRQSYPKKHVCSRCCAPRNPCRPMVSVMMLPIPFLNPFWWAETCHPRPCGPSIPECYHEGSDPETERSPTIA
jgi:hypothetical protein